MTHDQNVNVRLAAIDVLKQFAQSPSDQQNRPLRDALVQSISTQPSPLVQISLIDTMVQLRERDAVRVLRTLADDATVNKAVRQRATWGVRQLTQLS
jgi:HEAT repeats